MRWLALIPLLYPLPAAAHLGHLGDFAGHDHWVAGAAAGAAVAVGVWGWLKGRKEAAKAEAEKPEAEAEGEEA
jgi:hypothetical protein